MRQRTNDTLVDRVAIFNSTHVALNIEFLSLIPESINMSSFFTEIAEEMQLTFCEQIDNGCPVLVGQWSNVLNAEKKLEEFLRIWEEERNSAGKPKELPEMSEKESEHVLPSDSFSKLEACEVDSTLILSSNGEAIVSSGYDPNVLANPPKLFIVSGEVSHLQAPQLVRCTIANVKTAEQMQLSENHSIEKNSPTKTVEEDSSIKEIYVDIAVNPVKNVSRKNKPSKQCYDIQTSKQHPLDKLCQLLCIDEDEANEKRLCESEKKRKHEEKLPYKYFCDQCSFKAKRENHLHKHLKLHEKVKDVLCCDQCDFKTIRESVLCRHKMDHSSIQLLCKLCPYKTDSLNFLMKHMQCRHGPSIRKKMKCDYCDYVATMPRDLCRHKKLLHKSDNGPKFWKCSKCPYKSKLRAHLTRHDNDVHGTLRQFLCHYCGKSFKRNDTLTQHKIIHGEINKTFTCQHCGKVCTSSVFFREHLASHTTERPFLCDVCGSSFKTRGTTQRHKRAMHSNSVRLFPCTQCKRSFKSRSDLNRHRKTHRLKPEVTIVPTVITGANVQEDVITTPIAIQVVHTHNS